MRRQIQILRKTLIYCFLSYFFISTGSAQERTLTGTVKDFRNKRLAGVSVVVKNYPSITTLTGADGRFKLTMPQDVGALEFSISGMKTKTETLGPANHINVDMEYLPGHNPHRWNLTMFLQSYESNIRIPSKIADTSWKCEKGPGFGLMIKIEYFPGQKFGFSTGLGINNYQSKGYLNNFNNYERNTVQKTDKDNDTYYLYNQVSYLEEETYVKSFSLPLKAEYRFRQGKSLDFFVSGGIKFLYIRHAKVKARGESYWQGYYPAYHVVLYDLPEYGFTNYLIDTEREIQDYRKFMTAITGEIGLSKSLGKRTSLELGIFFERGITDLQYTIPVHEADYLNTVGPADRTSLNAIGFLLGVRYNFINKR
jgi:hypothetical protein